MALTVDHSKTNNIADWTQAELDDQIALGNYPPGTLLADIVLPSDWNTTHALTGEVSTAQIEDNAVTADKLADTAVTPASYTNTSLTVDQQGRITAASSGAAAGDVSSSSGVSVDNEIPRFDSTTGKIIQAGGTGASLDDAGKAIFPSVQAGGAEITGMASVLGAAYVNEAAGTATFDISGTGNIGMGRSSNTDASGTSVVSVQGTGNYGVVDASNTGTEDVEITVDGTANVVFASAAATTIFPVDIATRALSYGNFIQAYVSGYGLVECQASTGGNFIHALSIIGGNVQARTGSLGSFLGGYSSGSTSYIYTTAQGCVSHGVAASGGTLYSTQNAAQSWGFATGNGSYILASNFGSYAGGYVFGSTSSITSSGFASFVYALPIGGHAQATGTGSWQICGAGVNAQANSLQVGNGGMRINGTTTAPASPQNGDMYCDGTDVFVRTGGVWKNMSNI